jgi:hypothetical protein
MLRVCKVVYHSSHNISAIFSQESGKKTMFLIGLFLILSTRAGKSNQNHSIHHRNIVSSLSQIAFIAAIVESGVVAIASS